MLWINDNANWYLYFWWDDVHRMPHGLWLHRMRTRKILGSSLYCVPSRGVQQHRTSDGMHAVCDWKIQSRDRRGSMHGLRSRQVVSSVRRNHRDDMHGLCGRLVITTRQHGDQRMCRQQWIFRKPRWTVHGMWTRHLLERNWCDRVCVVRKFRSYTKHW